MTVAPDYPAAMAGTVKTLLSSIAVLASIVDCRAEPNTWSEWETARLDRFGPGEARGALVYLAAAISDTPEGAASLPLVEIARKARWDLIRINWRDAVDSAAQDADIVRFAVAEIGRVRQEGYAQIVVGGEGRGGGLAISVAASESVDGLLSLGPGAPAADFERQRDEMAGRLSRTRAKRAAVALYEGDPWDNLKGGRAAAFRQALQQSSAQSFILIDRPADLRVDGATASGRFTRRYRDCLVGLVIASGLAAGEGRCDLSKGYAAGADINLPDPRPPIRLPLFSDPALTPFLGRWQGDDARGAYVILEAIDVGQDSVKFRHGYSPWPERSMVLPWTDELRFRLEPGGREITHAFQNAVGSLSSRGTNELEYVLSYGGGVPEERFLLRRRRDQ